MRIIKLGLISLLALFIVIWLLSLLIPSQVRVSRAIDIPVGAEMLRPQVMDLQNWASWNYLLQQPGLRNPVFTRTGFNSDEMNVALVKADTALVLTRWIRKGQEPISSGIAMISAGANTTIVQFYFDFQVSWYPWEKFGSILFDRQIGPQLERSLEQLKMKCLGQLN